jgi:hypothetical protein
MIGILPNLPANVAGFRASGLVTKEDYEKVVFPEVERHKKISEHLNFVFFVDTPMKNFSLGAWIRDLWLGLKGFARWNKVAIISDMEKVRNFTDAVSPLFPGEYKGFSPDQLDAAVRWAATEEKEPQQVAPANPSAQTNAATAATPAGSATTIPSYIEELLPAQERGQSTVTSTQVTAASEKDAKFIFERAMERLQDVNEWSDYCGAMTSFCLIDEGGEPLQGWANVDDFIRIDLPGPGTREGEGYDWVQIEKVQGADGHDEQGSNALPSSPQQPRDIFLLQVRPSRNPSNKGSTQIAHFFEASATSTFIVERQDRTVALTVYGRNEVPNTRKPESLVDKWHNAAVGSIGAIGLSKLQWKALTEGLLEKE